MADSQKSILIVAPYGFDNHMLNYIEFLTARLLVKNGWKATALVQSRDGQTKSEQTLGVTVIRYGNLTKGVRIAASMLLTNRPRVVHIHNARNNRLGIIVSMLSKGLFIPTLFTEYGLLHNHYLTDDRDDPLNNPIHTGNIIRSVVMLLGRTMRKPGEIKNYLYNYLFNWPLCHADKIIFVSKHNVPIAQKIGLKNIIYLPQILDEHSWTGIGQLTPELRRPRSSPADNHDRPSVLFIGQIKRRKGWDILLEAITMVPETIISYFTIVSATNAESSAEFLKKASDLKIEKRIKFLGNVNSRAELGRVYMGNDMVVVPSRYEGFGLVPTEAFHFEKPVIASDVVALSEFLNDKNALLIPPGNPQALADAIIKLAQSAPLQKNLVEGGAETLREMESESLKKKWLDFYAGI